MFSATIANAQTLPVTTNEAPIETLTESKPWGIKVDGESLILDGFGLAISYSFFAKL